MTLVAALVYAGLGLFVLGLLALCADVLERRARDHDRLTRERRALLIRYAENWHQSLYDQEKEQAA